MGMLAHTISQLRLAGDVEGDRAVPRDRWLRGAFLGLTLLAVVLVLSGSVLARDWPQWRGPDSRALSEETDLPTTWGEDRNIAWRAIPAGPGVSSPIVWGDLVIVTSQVGDARFRSGTHPRLSRDDDSLSVRESAIGGARADRSNDVFLVVEAFATSDGKRAWEYRTRATGPFSESHESHNLATPTPTTDGTHIYAWYGNGQVVCLTMEGKRVWARHLGEDYPPFTNKWGHGSSPTLYDDLLILLVDHHPKAYLLALDKKTGRNRWLVDRESDRVSHSTPIVVPEPSGDALVINSSQRIDAYDPRTGALKWHAGEYRQTPIPTPQHEDGVIYLARGYRNSDVLALPVGGAGDVTDTIQWRTAGGGSYVPSILLYQGLIYMTNEIGVLTCVDAATGERVWRKRLGGIFFASPVGADGKVYFLSETGETYVLKAGREPDLLATNTIDERFIASPAIADGRIYLRSDNALYAIGAEEE